MSIVVLGAIPVCDCGVRLWVWSGLQLGGPIFAANKVVVHNTVYDSGLVCSEGRVLAL